VSSHNWDFLEYKNRWLRKLEGEMTGDDDCTSSPIIFDPPETPQTVIYEWDLPTFTRIYGCILKGAQLSYPDDWIQVTWDFLKGVDCPMSICEMLIDCIENDEDVQAALKGVIAQYNRENGAPGNLMPSDKQAENWSGDFNPECNPDIVWSECVKVVERCNTAIVDLFESISEADTIAKIAGVLASVPVIENVGISSLTDLADLLITLALTTYNDDYTTSWAEELECAVFCLCKGDCVVNFERIWSVLRPRIEDNIVGFVPPGNFLDMAGWAAAISNFAGELIELNQADLLFYLIFGGLAYGNVILNQNNIGAGILEIAVILASDEPSNDWEVLCVECPDLPVPVLETIAGACWSGDSGTNLVDLGAGNWSAEGTLYVPDNLVRVTVKRSDDGVFKFDDFTSNVGIAGAGWVLADDTCTAGAGVFPPVDTGLKSFVLVIQNTGTPLEISFSFYE